MRIAQVVLTKTKNENWKITVMSLKQTEVVLMSKNPAEVINQFCGFIHDDDWEQMPFDL